MSRSLIVQGIRVKDEKWEKMHQIYQHCQDLNIEIPDEVETYFGDEDEPDYFGVVVTIPNEAIVMLPEDLEDYIRYNSEYIDISKLPKDIRYIKAYMS